MHVLDHSEDLKLRYKQLDTVNFFDVKELGLTSIPNVSYGSSIFKTAFDLRQQQNNSNTVFIRTMIAVNQDPALRLRSASQKKLTSCVGSGRPHKKLSIRVTANKAYVPTSKLASASQAV